ncbi:hypothetical protein [Actinomyces sp. HMT897]|uniref:hypothetical protein n=1 Tax=Actinomyces sp. HMT897 TaxID=2789424 RepID=UPI00190D831E|nr:hypothetical protein [Actinomyces sp. HMT897]QQO78150.1 hypothetical protein JJJ15_01940 [Actinomyces sp. HMT897]DAR87816.1 MAG TPA: PGDYG protein [Caudoviricetes sp.]
MPISIYRTRPAVVEAVRWGTEDPATVWNWLEAHGCPWLVGNALTPSTLRPRDGGPADHGIWIRPVDGHLMIRTPTGDTTVMPGDYIVHDAAGGIHPLHPAAFEATYENVLP